LSKNSALKTRANLAVFLCYLVLSVGIFGKHVVLHPATFHVGEGTDPSQMMWLLVWWPYALIHRIDPFLTKFVWIPKGVNLAWMTCIPVPSLFAFPITYSFGPVVSYNVLSLLGPAFSAWTAYYLCTSVTGALAPALIGGYFYGFSSYEAGQVLGGHLSLSLVFIPPLLVCLYLSLVDGAISQRRFVICFTALLVIQFLISNEILATATVFGLIALVLAWCMGDSDIQSRLRRTIPGLIVCYILAAAFLTPYLYHTFAYGMPHHPLYPPEAYSADLVGFINPNVLSYFHHQLFGLDSRRFLPDPWENGAYLGIPILLLAVWYFMENRGTFVARLLGTLLLLLCLAALGPVLHVAGQPSLPLPWTVSVHLPLLKHALPGRFMLYAFLVLAVIASLWLCRPSGQAGARLALLLLCVLSLWPSVSSSRVTVPPFFTSGTYKFFLHKDEKVLVVPFGRTGESMLWQAESLMYFRMAGGWLGPAPAEFEHWPIVQGFLSSVLMPEADTQLKAFVGYYGVETVLLGDANRGPWSHLFSKLDDAPVRIGGVTIYKVGTTVLNEFRHTDALRAEGRANLARFSEMLLAASQYLRQGRDPAKLNCARAQELGLMPDRGESLAASNQLGWCYSMWFGPMGRDSIGIGLIGYYAGLKPVIERYGRYANSISYPYPDKLAQDSDPGRLGALMLTFDRGKLALATAAASNEGAPDQITSRLGGYVTNPPSPPHAPGQIQHPASLAQAATYGASASSPVVPEAKPDDSPGGPRPVVIAVDGIAVSKTPRGNLRKATGAPVVPARRASWGPWWREAEADDVVVIDGHGFDTRDGVAVDLYCACPGGEVGPFFFEPYYQPFSATQIFLKVPVYGDNAPLPGPGSIIVSNKGRDGQYAAKSNRVPVWIGSHN
jgi:hypothetical protein